MLTFSYPWIFLLLPLPFVLRKLFRPYQEERPAVRTPFFDELLELSGQEAGNGSKDGKKITRLAAVKEVLDGFLVRRKGDRVGLIFF